MRISDWSSDVCSSDLLARIDSMVQAAIASGARVVTGGSIIDGPGNFFAPTIFTDVQNSSAIVQEEIFGPVHVVLHLSEEEEAIRMENDSDIGLHGRVFNRELEHAFSRAGRHRRGDVR